MTKKNDTTSYTPDMQTQSIDITLMLKVLTDQQNRIEEKIDVGLSEVKQDVKDSRKEQADQFSDLRNKIEKHYVTKTELTEIKDVQKDHENRTRTLEKSIGWWTGASAVIGAVMGYLVPFILGKL